MDDINICWSELRKQLENRHLISRKTKINSIQTETLLAYEFIKGTQLNDNDVIYTNTHLILKRVPIDFARHDPATFQAYNRPGRVVGDMPRRPVENKNG